MSLPAHYDRQEITSLTPKPCQSCPIRFVCSSLACARVSAVRHEVDVELECRCHRLDNAVLRGTFPEGIAATMQYGQETRALAIALLNEGAVSAQRTHDILSALAGRPVSVGSIIAWNLGLSDDLLKAGEDVVLCMKSSFGMKKITILTNIPI